MAYFPAISYPIFTDQFLPISRSEEISCFLIFYCARPTNQPFLNNLGFILQRLQKSTKWSIIWTEKKLSYYSFVFSNENHWDFLKANKP